jgi:4-diphosphocytidyl-2-C-methyl-D-erythritol kinase
VIRLLAHAKVNYALEILGTRPDGYHELKTVLQSISLADEVSVERSGEGIELVLDPPAPHYGPPESNTVYRAWEVLQSFIGRKLPVRIAVHKRIPAGAGLGGGSADAAAALAGTNELYGLGLSPEELARLGVEVGADVPFCVLGGTMLGEGIGERLFPLPPPPPHHLVVAKPAAGASTPEVYRTYDALDRPRVASAGPVSEALAAGSLNLLAAAIENDLTAATVPQVPEVGDLKSDLLRAGALGAEMTGSGTAVYGIFEDRASAGRAADALGADFVGVYEPVASGLRRL